MPVLISQRSGVQLLGVPKIGSSSGRNMADGVFTLVNEWNVTENIIGLSFDITNPNSGHINGACAILEYLFKRPLLKLACRHHLYEIMLRGAFEAKFGDTTGPNPSFFENFRIQWNSIDQSKYTPGIQNPHVRHVLNDVIDDIIQFCQRELEKDFSRGDYRELLELTLIFLGDDYFPRGVRFCAPGANHHARWISKALYALKMFMFMDQYDIEQNYKIPLRDFCVFVIRFYVRAWTRCTNALEAPQQDLNFLKEIHAYSNTDRAISEVVTKKFGTHLWYLGDETIALAFFDDKVSFEEKRAMRRALDRQPEKDDSTIVFRLSIKPEMMQNVRAWRLSGFITENTINFFERFGFSTDFMQDDPSEWSNNEDYIEMQKTLAALEVVNDNAERTVKLFADRNTSLTKDEKQKQYLMQVVRKYNENYPGISKSNLTKI